MNISIIYYQKCYFYSKIYLSNTVYILKELKLYFKIRKKEQSK